MTPIAHVVRVNYKFYAGMTEQTDRAFIASTLLSSSGGAVTCGAVDAKLKSITN
jgi:hypothetical protein